MADKAKKHVDSVPKFEDYLAPWETAAGETEIDKTKLKKYIHGVVLDAAKRADRAEEAEAKVTEAEAKVTEVEGKLAAADSSGEIARLTEELKTAKASAESSNLDLTRIKVGDEAGLTIKQSLRLQGTDEESLAKDAEDILETFGVKKVDPDETDEEREEREEQEEEEAEASQNPLRRSPLRNPADSRQQYGADSDVIDIAKAVDGFRKNVL